MRSAWTMLHKFGKENDNTEFVFWKSGIITEQGFYINDLCFDKTLPPCFSWGHILPIRRKCKLQSTNQRGRRQIWTANNAPIREFCSSSALFGVVFVNIQNLTVVCCYIVQEDEEFLLSLANKFLDHVSYFHPPSTPCRLYFEFRIPPFNTKEYFSLEHKFHLWTNIILM